MKCLKFSLAPLFASSHLSENDILVDALAVESIEETTIVDYHGAERTVAILKGPCFRHVVLDADRSARGRIEREKLQVEQDIEIGRIAALRERGALG